MKKIFTLLAAVAFYLFSWAQAPVSFYSYSWPNFNNDTINMSEYAGKKLMIVNVASQCVFTPNFGPLERLDSSYRRFNFEVIGFPCDDFAGEEGTDSQLIVTCNTYHVNFPIMSSVRIISGDTAPIYKWLQCKSLNGVSNATVTWNFNMFLIGRQGEWVQWYAETENPMDTAITNWIIDDSASLTGIMPLLAPEALSLKSANPTGSSIILQETGVGAQNMDVYLYSADRRLISTIYHGDTQNGMTLNYPVGSLASGVYLIKASTSQGQQVLRCVVEH